MERQYKSMSVMPSHGNAARRKVGNAGMQNHKEGFQMMGNGTMAPHYGSCGCAPGAYSPGMMGPQMETTCHFPQPPPKRCYCNPSAFTSIDGREYHRILNAYGNSRPCQSYY